MNLELMVELEKNEKLLKLVEEVREIKSRGLVAAISKKYLDEITLEGICNADERYDGHEAAKVLAILTHTQIEWDFDDPTYRFSESLYGDKPFLPGNIVKVADKSCRWGKWALKGQSIEEKPELHYQMGKRVLKGQSVEEKSKLQMSLF
jgi:hypothetical protein